MPFVLRNAGTAGNSVSVVRHVGRTSGSAYETPVTAVPTDDGFVIALPYGAGTDWVENVLAADSAELVNDGTTYRVDQPEVIAIDEVGHHFGANERRAHRWFAVDQCLRLHTVAVAASGPIVEGD